MKTEIKNSQIQRILAIIPSSKQVEEEPRPAYRTATYREWL